ncbi:dicarboxylate/amino acid:cation symporter [Bacillus changyiensis]|uniref:dicarboxylate/amino acid:cation symporter n=1 Tax=Bacillus changyiensis TaxID=3004103 RepID=UPI0022E30B49|nr:dicarboxylate/amino acid:cation symporter [Bacillus changyiensis]MDA1477708.1 dicarboxylate/amino acid:cation symporter [Bacillus changyiensis]
MKFGLLPRIITAIVLGVIIGSFAPLWLVKTAATFNGIFGNFIKFVIPFIIIAFIVPGIGQIGRGAGKILGITAGIAYLSTIIAGLLAYLVGTNLLPSIIAGHQLLDFKNPEEVLQKGFFSIEMNPFMDVMSALIFSFIMGIGIAYLPGKTLKNAFDEFQTIVEKLISYIIIPLLPIHIFGIFANMTYGGQVQTILSVFAKVFVMIIVLHIVILLLQYTVAGLANKRNPFALLKIVAPAYFTALGTQSSAATIPVTLRQVRKTGASQKVADFAIPLLANIHLSGSTITLTSCAMGVMILNGQTPTFTTMMPFILMLGITMVAAPGAPGGAVMAALGLLQSMLGFNETSVSLMIALYLAQDSLGTATNVTGDGALTMLVHRLTAGKEKDLPA